MKDFTLRNDTRLLMRNDPVADPTELTKGKRVLIVYGGGSVKRNGCCDDIKKATQQGGATLYELGGAKYRKSPTTIHPRFLTAMAKYHDEEIRRFPSDAFGFEGEVSESEQRLVELLTSLGVDMYFEGEAALEAISRIDIETALSAEEVLEIVKKSMS